MIFNLSRSTFKFNHSCSFRSLWEVLSTLTHIDYFWHTRGLFCSLKFLFNIVFFCLKNFLIVNSCWWEMFSCFIGFLKTRILFLGIYVQFFGINVFSFSNFKMYHCSLTYVVWDKKSDVILCSSVSSLVFRPLPLFRGFSLYL